MELQHYRSQTDFTSTPRQQGRWSGSLLTQLRASLARLDVPLQRTASTAGLMTAASSELLPDAGAVATGPSHRGRRLLSVPDGLPLQAVASLIRPEEIEICQRDDGHDWVLGAGTYGVVSAKPHHHIYADSSKSLGMSALELQSETCISYSMSAALSFAPSTRQMCASG